MRLRKQAALERARNLSHQVSSVTFHLLSLFSKVPTNILKQTVMFKRDYFESMVMKQGHSKEMPDTPELAAGGYPPSVCRVGAGRGPGDQRRGLGEELATDPTHREGGGAGRSRFTLQHPAVGPIGNQRVRDHDVTPEERRVPSASGDKRRIPSAPGAPSGAHLGEPPRTKHFTIWNHLSHWPYISFYLHN